MAQIIQIVGSLLILSAYTAAQRGGRSQSSRTYLVLNLVGSTVLTVSLPPNSSSAFSCSRGVGR
jgi:hypothetical protein